MFFSGDSSARKRVDLGGRSSKERDRQKLLEQTRLERNRRLWVRTQNSAAIKIQKCFRGRKAVEAEHLRVRGQFFMTYGKHCQHVDRRCFRSDSDFLRQLLFFFNPRNHADFSALVETCRLLQQFVRESGDILSLFAGIDYSSSSALVDYRMKQLAYACIWAVHHNRNQLLDQLFLTSDKSSSSTILLLEAVVMLIDPRLPWSCKIVGYLLQRNTYNLLREIILTGKERTRLQDSVGKISSLESVLALLISHVGQGSCVCPNIDPRWSFSSQILTIPFLWKLFPYLKEVFATRGLNEHYIHQMALCVQNHANVLPNDVSTQYPGYACLLGNLLETAGVAFSQPDCSFDTAIDFAAVATFLLEALPPIQASNRESKENFLVDEDEMMVGDEEIEKGLNRDLELQISNAIDSRFLLQLTSVLFGGISPVNGSHKEGPHGEEVVAVGAACAFLHVTLNILPLERTMTVLAYRTELVPVLWKFMKQCHENQKWSALSGHLTYLPADAPGWLLPLSVFCPVYKHMLTIVDNEEFYEQEKPLSLKDIKCLIVILRQALWQLLWVNPIASPNLSKSTADVFSLKRHPLEFIQHRVSIVASDLLSQETADHLLYPNPGSLMVHEQHLQYFHFLGTVLAKAMFEGILVDIPFATFFLSKLKQKYNYLNDLPSLDPELYRHLIFLKRYEGDIAELELYFVIENNEYGEQTEEELLPRGKSTRVTNEKVITYIHLIANHRLNFQIRQQSSHFLRGFQQLIQKDWIDMFNEHELQLLIAGSMEGFDVKDLRAHTNYAGGYHSEHYVIDMFWAVLSNFSRENQMKFLKFVTGCSRGPLLGFKFLEPLFCIQRAAGNASEEALDRLPTSATCMNLLKLPPYRSKEQLEQKLLYAINADAGFDLS
ncbi:E3 ubiquitin-protein ligase UPL6 isoform X3 [Rhododendron vialii]|uniref:E3 ubiquitin-protein ligase UPL6 isoform X3 n=1 Tax=Rhododendron vialii TaxID=182163 RepID=UPI00265D7E3B|nr:E3 ubiquitin-protein ligase UPL6 isoform X3 [Rhododendron vialii]